MTDTIKGTNSNDIITGTSGNDKIDGRGGDDILFGLGGNDELKGGDGNDRIYGNGGDDLIFGDGSGGGSGDGAGSGGAVTFNDDLDGGAGNDVLFGDAGASDPGGATALWKLGDDSGSANSGSGRDSDSADTGFADYLDGGSGNDFIFAGSGNDEVNHGVTENIGATDHYAGGEGVDILTLNMTKAEWFQPEVQADISAYLKFISNHTDPGAGEADSTTFQFTAFNLSVREFEKLRILVNGAELNPADEAVTANDDVATLNEDNAATTFGSVLGNDVVPDLAYSVALVTGPAEGNLVFNEGTPGNPDGSFSFDPAGGFEDLAQGASRNVSFVYEVTDANGDTSQATVTITVTGSNDGPVAVADTGITDENAAIIIDVLANDTDVDLSDTHTVDAVSVGANSGSASIVGNQVQWDPGTDYDYLAVGQAATVVLSYDMSDNNGAASSSTVTITVTGTNDSPVAVIETASGLQDQAIRGQLVASDVDTALADLVYSVRTGPAHGVVTVNPDGSYSYIGNQGFVGTDSFIFGVSDGQGGSDTQTATITVASGYPAPVIDNVIILTPHNDSFTGQTGNQQIEALAGNDWIVGDFVDYTAIGTVLTGAGIGGDLINGGPGLDKLFGDVYNMGASGYTVSNITLSTGNDVLNGQDGVDELYGDSFYMQIDHTPAGFAATLNGGNDVLNGGNGIDWLYGDAAYMHILTGNISSISVINGGNDSLSGGVGNDHLLGDAWRMQNFPGNQGAIEIHGGADLLIGGLGDDILIGEAEFMWSRYANNGSSLITGGNDTLDGGVGNDTLYGEGFEARVGHTNSTIFSNSDTILAGDDTLHGGAGDDVIYGDFAYVFSSNNPAAIVRGGSDLIDGGAGNDQLYGDFLQGAGIYGNTVTGGADVFVFAAGSGVDTIHDFELGQDRIDVTGYGFAALSDMTVTAMGLDTLIDFGAGNSVMLLGAIGVSATDFLFV